MIAFLEWAFAVIILTGIGAAAVSAVMYTKNYLIEEDDDDV